MTKGKKDTASFIKKVSSAGRRGDTELAYLSPKARDLLKKLGGAGTKNPKTKIKEFYPEFTAFPEWDEETGRQAAALREQMAGMETSAAPATAAQDFDRLMEVSQPGQEPIVSAPAALSQPAPVVPQFDAQSALAAMAAAREQMPAAIAELYNQPAPPSPAPVAAPALTASRVREQEDLWRPRDETIGQRPGLISPRFAPIREVPDERVDRAAEEAARREAETEARARAEEANRKAAEEAARKAAEEEAARRAAEEAAARRAAEEQARIRAAEEARIREAQDAQARRAAEEARRVAEEAARRTAEEAAARRAAEEEAARRAAEEEAARRTAATAPAPTPAPPPLGLIESKLPTAPSSGTTVPGAGNVRTSDFIDDNLNGIDDRDERTAAPAPTPAPDLGGIRTGDFIDENLNGVDDRDEPAKKGSSRAPTPAPDLGRVRTGDFIDKNLNGIDDRDEPAKKGSSRDWFNLIGGVDPNSDVGRLIARLRPGGARKSIGAPSVGGSTGTLPPVTSPVAPAPLPTAPVAPPASMPPSSGYIPQPIPTPGYVAAPLPQMPGAGTPTPFFQPNAGGLTPGTLPVSGPAPQSLVTSNVPLQAIGANPNLSPNVLGGQQNLGYYTDRMGNLIMSPGAVRPPGFAKGGSADAELLEDLEAFREAEGLKDIDSARAMLEQLSNEPGISKTQVALSPNAQSVRRATRRPIRQETDRGTAKGMAVELEQVTEAQGPRAKSEGRSLEKRMELLRNTLGMPTFSQPTLARAGDLMAKRFNEGGEAESPAREKLGQLLEMAGRGARKMKRGAAGALGIEDILARAEKESEAAYGKEEAGGGKADAMRHLMYQAGLTRKWSPTAADVTSRLYEGLSPGQSDREQAMDLYNDMLGREIGRLAKSEEDVARLAKEYVESKKARVLPKGERTGYRKGGEVKKRK